jgi:hypothetical protein
MTRRIACILVALCVLLVAGRARANDNRVGILRIDTEGVSDTVALQFEQEIVSALEGVGFEVTNRADLLAALANSDFIDGCSFGPCLRAVHEATGLELVLTARIQGEGSSFSVIVSLIDTRTGFHTSQDAQKCAVCTLDEAISTASLATVGMATGTGGAAVADPSGDPTRPVTSAKKVNKNKAILKRSGLIFIGTGAVAAFLGAYFTSAEDETLGAVGLVSGATLIAGGGTMVLLSRRF